MKVKPFINRLFNKLNLHKRISQLDGNPSHIAGGYSLGLFIGLMPLVGVKAFIAVAIASFLKWNKLAAGFGVFNINPITAPFFFGLNFLVGKQITGCSEELIIPERLGIDFFATLLHSGSDIMKTLFVGGIALGIPLSVIAYCVTYGAIKKLRN